jgi:hypothetical protein
LPYTIELKEDHMDASNANKLYESLKNVNDYHSFLLFVQALIDDREDEVEKEKAHPSEPYGPGANGWENWTIEYYLDAALRCEIDNAALGRGMKEPSWQAFAQFLYDGKHYE